MGDDLHVRVSPDRWDALIQLATRAPLSAAEAIAIRDWQREAIDQVRRDAAAQRPATDPDPATEAGA